MCEIDEKEWIFYVIAAVGFCNFILHSLYLSPEFGFVLVVDDDSQIRVLERILDLPLPLIPNKAKCSFGDFFEIHTGIFS